MDATRGEQTQAAKRGLSMPVNHRVRWLFPLLTWLVAAAMALVLTLSLPGSEAHATGPVATVSPAASTENVSVSRQLQLWLAGYLVARDRRWRRELGPDQRDVGRGR